MSSNQIEAAAQSLPDWETTAAGLRREFRFRGFKGAMGFVGRVAELAETAQHHPDIDIRFNRVILTLITHDAGGLTEKDFVLASQIDALSGG